MKKTTHEHLGLLFFLLWFLWGTHNGLCRSENLDFYFSKEMLILAPIEQETLLLSANEGNENETLSFMPDTACIAQSRDTFFVNTVQGAIIYDWMLPAGASIAHTLGDTMIVVDWTRATPGLSNICLSIETDCGTSDPSCFPIQISICHSAPNAVDDERNTSYQTPVIIAVQNNDFDPDNDSLTISFDPSNNPTNGTIAIIDNAIQYTPSNNFTGTDDFNYILCDDGIPSLCDTALVTIIVENESPAASPDTAFTTHGTAVTILVQSNDSDLENGDLTTLFDPDNSPANGTAVLNGPSIIYTPDLAFTGRDSFNYVICDNGMPVQCDTSMILVIVENQAPTATNDTINTSLNTPVIVLEQDNDTDLENGNLTTTLDPTNGPTNGIVNITGGELVYTPNENFSGEDSFNYIICDNGTPSQCDTATVIVRISNGLPIAIADSGMTWMGVPVTIDVQENDSDPENGPLITLLDPDLPATNGSVMVLNNDSILYTSNVGYTGMDQFGYIICDDAVPPACDTTFVSIHIPNEPPIARGDLNYTLKDIPVDGAILDNDFDPNGDKLILSTVLIQNTIHGILNLYPNGTYTYTPGFGFTGTDIFQYEICDDNLASLCDTGTVTIQVIEVDFNNNRPPVATPDDYVIEENTVLSSNIRANDFDPDEDAILLNTSPLIAPDHGNVIILPNGDFNYSPDNGFWGEDNFTYNICDDGTPFLCDTATVVINIIKSFRNTLFASDDVVVGNANTSLGANVLSNDFDPEGDSILVTSAPIISPANGTLEINSDGSFTYIPKPNYIGPDYFRYEICDNRLPKACDTATVYLAVLKVNNAPFAIDDINITLIAQPTVGNILDNDFDLENDDLILNTTPVNNVVNGTLTLDPDGTYTYVPDAGFVGEDIFTYEICDDGTPVLCDTAIVTIEVVNDDLSKNDPPIGINDIYISLTNVPISGNLLANDFDPDGDGISIFTEPVDKTDNGTVMIDSAGSFAYVPDFNFNGDDYFTYTICDDGTPSLCDTVRVSLTIIPRNSELNYTFANDDAALTQEDHPVTGNLLINDSDPEGNIQTIHPSPLERPEHGRVLINLDGTFSYYPYANYNGTDQFTYRVCDNGTPAACDTATVFLAILPVADPPFAKNDINTTLVNHPVTGQVLTNDEEPDGDALLVNTTPLQSSQYGMVLLNANGTYTYTPDLDFSGEDNFKYIVCDDQVPALCDTATVFITVIDYTNPANNSPEGVEDHLLTLVNSPLNGDLLSNDRDPDSDPLIINTAPVSQPNSGTLVINPDGTFTYIPNPDFTGEDQFHYEVCDINIASKCDTVLVTIEVIPSPGNIVFANDDVASGKEDSQIQGNLLANDYDPQGDQIIVHTSPTRFPQHGTVIVNPNGTFTYVPATDYNGADRFEYQICDDGIPSACDIASVFINIIPVNDTICNIPLATPTLLSNDNVCFTDSIYLFTQENYPPIILENPNADYQFIWYNGLGDSIALTSVSEFKIAASDDLAIAPFTLKVRSGSCYSPFSLPKFVELIDLPTIIANVSGGNNAICKGENVQLTASDITNGVYMWRILGSTDIISTDRNPIIFGLDTTTTFEVLVIPEGCDTGAVATVRVEVKEVPNIDPVANYTLNPDCSPSDLMLIANSNTASIATYEWTGPDDFSSDIENPTILDVQENANGTYMLEVVDVNGCAARASVQVINISNAPIQPIIHNAGPVCEGELLKLSIAQYEGVNIQYSWMTPANTTQDIIGLTTNEIVISPIDSIIHSGDYSAMVMVEGCTLTTAAYAVNVSKKPTLTLDTDQAGTICEGGTLGLISTPTGEAPFAYEWNGPLGFTSIASSPSIANVTTAHNGTYTLKVSDANACFIIENIDINQVVQSPKQPIIANNSTTCIDDTIRLNTLTSYTGVGISYQWLNGLGDSIGDNRFLKISRKDANAIDPFLLQITADGCPTVESNLIEIADNKNQTIALATASAALICRGEQVQLYAREEEEVSYEWRILGDATIISILQNPIFDNLQQTTDYLLTVRRDACDNQFSLDTIRVGVSDGPIFSPSASYTLKADCSPSDLFLNVAISSDTTGLSFNWTGPNGFVSSQKSPVIASVTETFNGIYLLEITDESGCSKKESLFINDIKKAQAIPSISSESIACENDNLFLEVPIYEGNFVQYNWYENGVLLDVNNSNKTFIDNAQKGQEFTLEIIVDGCRLQSDTFAPVVLGQPLVVIDSTYETMVCAGEASEIRFDATITGGQAPYEVEWRGPNGFHSFSEDPLLINTNSSFSGTYSINIADQNGCTHSASTEIEIKDTPLQPMISSNSLMCEGTAITITAPAYEGLSVSYYWNVPDSTNVSGLGTNELVIAPADASLHSGDYTLTVAAEGCSSNSNVLKIAILENFDFNPTAIYTSNLDCTSSDLVLNANIGDSIIGMSYQWTGPNGFTSNLPNPIIVNADSDHNGIYELTITNSTGCAVTAGTNLINTIKAPLSKPIIQSEGAICEGNLLTLSAPIYTGSAVAYTWTLNGMAIPGENSNTIIVGPIRTNTDQYQLTVQVDGCTLSSDIFALNGFPSPSIRPDYTLNTICEGGHLQLRSNLSNTTGNIDYQWSGPSGFTSKAANPLITNISESANGTYTLKVRTIYGCETSESLSISEITDLPEQPVILSNSPVCSGSDIELSIQQTNLDINGQFIWLDSNGDTIGTEKTISLKVNNNTPPAPYQAAVSISGCTSILSAPAFIDLIEMPQVSASNSGPICQGQEVQLMAPDIEGATYFWYDVVTGILISNQQNPTIFDVEETTTFDLKVEIEGCMTSDKIQTTVEVDAVPSIKNISKSASYCAGETVLLTAQSNNPLGQPLVYTWTGPNNFIYTAETDRDSFGLELPNITDAQAGVYELTLRSPNACTSDPQSVIVNVRQELNTPALNAVSNLICGGESIELTASLTNGTAIAYEWYQQNEQGDLFLIKTTSTPSLIINNVNVTHSGEYLVRITKGNCASGYSNVESIKVIDATSSIEASNNSSSLSPICEGDIIQLSLPFLPGASYSWFGPNGYTSDKYNPAINPATALDAGDYFAVVELEGCASVVSSTTRVYIGRQPAAPTIISNGPVCAGETLVLEISSSVIATSGDKVEFEWYNATTDAVVAKTIEPLLRVEEVRATFSDSYHVRTIINGCLSEFSNEIRVEVLAPTELIAFAGIDQTLCAAAAVHLEANEVSAGVGQWQSLTGATIVNPYEASTEALNLNAGLNQFVWTVTSDVCGVNSADTVAIMVDMLTDDRAFAGLDRDLCEVTAVQLDATALNSAKGTWTQSNEQEGQGVLIIEPENPKTNIEGLEPGNTYSFTWTISQGICNNFESDELLLTINDIPPDNALIKEETIYICEEDQLAIAAEVPTLSTGYWQTNSGATIADPTSPTTFIENLDLGENVLVWSLSNGACANYSTDTLRIYSEGFVMANADNYTINPNDSLNFDVLLNDVISLRNNLSFIITKYPNNGKLREAADGTLSYIPANNYFGIDDFRYKICNTVCGELCDTALVTLRIEGNSASGNCIIPNVISPNGDGDNDQFVISCISQFPNNHLSIFNRWGGVVYEVTNYQNDWEGTYKNRPLPAGTYFYTLQLGEGKVPIQGFISLFR